MDSVRLASCRYSLFCHSLHLNVTDEITGDMLLIPLYSPHAVNLPSWIANYLTLRISNTYTVALVNSWLLVGWYNNLREDHIDHLFPGSMNHFFISYKILCIPSLLYIFLNSVSIGSYATIKLVKWCRVEFVSTSIYGISGSKNRAR